MPRKTDRSKVKKPAEATFVKLWRVGHSASGYVLIDFPEIGIFAMTRSSAEQLAEDIKKRLISLSN